MGKDENMGKLYKQSLDLLTQATSFIIGEFSRVSVQTSTEIMLKLISKKG
jgi:hypothetical protein